MPWVVLVRDCPLPNYPVDTTSGSKERTMARKTGAPEDSEIEVTPVMIEAGVRILLEWMHGERLATPERVVRTIYSCMRATVSSTLGRSENENREKLHPLPRQGVRRSQRRNVCHNRKVV